MKRPASVTSSRTLFLVCRNLPHSSPSLPVNHNREDEAESKHSADDLVLALATLCRRSTSENTAMRKVVLLQVWLWGGNEGKAKTLIQVHLYWDTCTEHCCEAQCFFHTLASANDWKNSDTTLKFELVHQTRAQVWTGEKIQTLPHHHTWYLPPSSFFLASPGSTWTSWRMRGRRVTIPVPRGRRSLPTRLSSTELLPLLCRHKHTETQRLAVFCNTTFWFWFTTAAKSWYGSQLHPLKLIAHFPRAVTWF